MKIRLSLFLLLVFLTSCMDHYELGEKYFKEGDYKNAEIHIERAAKIERGNWRILYNLARSKEELGKYDKAIELYSQSLDIKNTIASHLGRARCYEHNDYYLKGAIIDYSEALKIKRKDNFEAFYGRGRVYIKEVNYYKALWDINQAINIKPKHVNAYYHRAIIRSQIGDNTGALNDMNYVIEKTDGFLKAHFNRGIIYQRLGVHKSAVRDFDKAINLGIKKADVYVRRGKSHLQLGNTIRAFKDFEVAEKLNPKLRGLKEKIRLKSS